MRIFVTGATGFIGSAVVKELIAADHQVIGLCRSDDRAPDLAAAGAEVLRGDLRDLDSLRSGADRADAVIHLAFIHDFTKFQENCAIDGRAIEALTSVLEGSDRPLIVTSGLLLQRAGPTGTESDKPAPGFPRVSEAMADAAVAKGINASTMRLPQVHDAYRQGLVSPLIQLYRQKGECIYVGEGRNRWPAAHYLDVARLYRLAIEQAQPGAAYHAVAEEGVSLRQIAETIGKRLDLPVRSIAPEEAEAQFGWLGGFVGLDMPSSSAETRRRFGWEPTGPGLIADLERLPLD